MKEYFSHDYHARNDSKMIQLIMQHGLNGIGAYWCIIEMLYESGGYLMQSECERIAFELRTQCDLIRSVINSDLFQKDDEKFWSDSVHRRLDIRSQKSDKARESAYKRWNNKDLQSDANAMRTQCDGNAIKVNKIKEKKSKYGEYKHVLLTDEELEKLKVRFSDWSRRVKNLDEYLQQTGKSYKDHYLTILKWAEKDKPEPKSDVNKTNELIERIKQMGNADV